MNADLLMVLGLLVAAVAMFVINRPRMDAVALIMIAVMPLTGIVSVNEALAGFSDPNIVLIGALFVIGEGLVRTGVARGLGDWLYSKAGSSETKLLVLLMLAVGGLGSLMSSTAVVAIFIPVVLRIARNTGTSPSRLMMPLSVAALVSGMMTLVATAPNLVVNAELTRRGAAGFHFFSFTPFGLPLLVLAVLYMLFARRWLPATADEAGSGPARRSLKDWVDQYGLVDRAFRVRVRAGSPVVGRSLADLVFRARGVNLLAIERAGRFGQEVVRPQASTKLQAGDVLLVDAAVGAPDRVALAGEFGVEPLPMEGGAYFSDRSQDLGMAEAIVSANSDLVGKTVLQARVRSEYGLTVIGLKRGRTVVTHDQLTQTLRVGDTLLLVGFWSALRRLGGEGSDVVLLNMPAESEEVLAAPGKSAYALGCLALVVMLMVTGLVPNVQAALIGCLLMGLFGCVDMSSAYHSISWKSIVLIVGMLPFSIALQRTGGVTLAADALISMVGGASPRLILATLFVVTAALGLFISNTATAVLMAPVALEIAKEIGASPYPLAMVVALAASAAFMTPISSPVNTLVVGPGNYRFGDFVRVGVPFTIVVLLVAVLLVPVLLPF